MIYKLANKILKENDIVAVETLDVKSMYQIHKIAKHLKNLPIREFIRVLKYKSNWQGKKVIEINKYYPSRVATIRNWSVEKSKVSVKQKSVTVR